jgi:hypothetical protein
MIPKGDPATTWWRPWKTGGAGVWNSGARLGNESGVLRGNPAGLGWARLGDNL